MSDLSEQTASEAVQEIGPNTTLQWLDGGRIAVLQVNSVAFETIDAWVDMTLQLMDEHDASKPMLVLHDVSDPNLSLTPHIRSRMQTAARAHPELGGRVAVLISRSGSGLLLKLFLDQLARFARRRPKRVFFERDKALAWLRDAPETLDQ